MGQSGILDDFARDLGFAVRMLRKSPVFTAVAIVTLTLAIGANTAVFTLVNELMLKSVPAPNAKRLAILRIQPDPVGYAFSYPLFRALEQRSGAVMRVFAFTDRTFNLRTRDGLETIAGEFVSGEYLPALGTEPELGRWIDRRDDGPGAPGGMTAVVSAQFWRNHMGAKAEALGQKIDLDHAIFTVVGVLPKGFRGMSRDRVPDVFVPLQAEPLVDSPFSLIAVGYRAWWLSVGGLLDDGVSLRRTNAFLATSSRDLFAAAPPGFTLGPNGHKLADLHVIAEPGANGLSQLRVRFRKPLGILTAFVAIVLFIACLNLAILLLARAASRARELSTRSALGASRGRLIRQLLTESLLLAIVGAVLGLAAAPALANFIAITLVPEHGTQFAPLKTKPDLTVFAFTALLAVVATVVTGTLPGLRSTGSNFVEMVREGSHSIRGAARRRWWPRVLLVTEFALSLMLATGAGLLGYSFLKLHRTALGFQPHGLVFLVPQGKQPLIGPRLLQGYKEAIQRIRSLPDVSGASVSVAVPISSGYINEDVQAIGGPKYHFQENAVGPDYFKTMRTPLLAGREFRWDDAGELLPKLILNSSAARLLFADAKPIGHTVLLQDGKTQAEVIGVVADSKFSSVRDEDPPTVYTSAMQGIIPGASLNILIRTAGPVKPLIDAARTIAKQSIPDVPVSAALNMEELIAESLATERVMSTLALFFGGLCVLITGIGLYGTLAYATELRTGEIGVRFALGAQPRHIIAAVSAENALIAAFGCLAGIAGSLLTVRALASLVYGISVHDPLILVATAGVLICVAAAASLIPAAKAARIDPLSAIRHE